MNLLDTWHPCKFLLFSHINKSKVRTYRILHFSQYFFCITNGGFYISIASEHNVQNIFNLSAVEIDTICQQAVESSHTLKTILKWKMPCLFIVCK